MSNTVHVKNIAHSTSEKEVTDFFSFCGKITSLSITPTTGEADSPQSATVTFEKEAAAKTALLLDNTQLGPSQVQVSSSSSIADLAGSGAATDTKASDSDDIEQEDKPRSRIVAEYLAHGYVLGDTTLQRALDLDKKHGISSRFTSALANLDKKVKATDKAKAIDSSYGVTDKGIAAWRGVNSYFEKALGTPTGQRLATFYTSSEKQVLDIHAEARRLADLKKASETESSTGEKVSAEGVAAAPASSTTTEKTG